MAEIIPMPKLSDTMSVGVVAKWLKKEGEAVAIGDILCEIETDKATMELENLLADGILLKIYVQEGGKASVGASICAIGQKGEKVPEPKLSEAVVTDAPAETSSSTVPTQTPPTPSTPSAPVSSPATVTASSAPPPAQAAPADTTQLKASPLARKVAAERGIALAHLKGSGPGGRILKHDVLSASDSGSSALQMNVLQEKLLPVSGIRAITAERLVMSKSTIPHFYLNIEVNAGPLLDLRATFNARLQAQGGSKLSVNDFILRAAAQALCEVPAANASWEGETIRYHAAVHLGFGVATEEGLLVPVLQNAHSKRIQQLSVEAKGLIELARSKKLTPDQMQGSTFTVTNLGMYGITNFSGIINPPNAAILAVGAVRQVPVVSSSEEIVVGRQMQLNLSCDHRVMDGSAGAEFLLALKELLEAPGLLLA